MLTLNDGRSELWQWDTGRTLAVDADCSQVHFSNKVFGRSIDVDVVDGVAIIPDVLLQTDKDMNVWAFVGTAENGYTKISKTFKVNRRNKPADYVFTPPEQTTLAELVERLDKIEESQDPDAIKNAVENYLEQNPVEIPVQSVNGQTGAVELTADDVGAISQDDLQNATNEALAQAKASGEFDGPQGPEGPQGPKGDTGATGQKGDKGDAGAAGADGKSAYAYAVEGGYTGTEAEFAEKLAAEIPVVDATLTQSGQAADAKAIGDALSKLSEEKVTIIPEQPYKTQEIGQLYPPPNNYTAWCPNCLHYDAEIDRYVMLIFGRLSHTGAYCRAYQTTIDPYNYESDALTLIKFYDTDGVTDISPGNYGVLSWAILSSGEYFMIARANDDVTYSFTSADYGKTWVKRGTITGFSGHPWNTTELSNGRILLSTDSSSNDGIYYSDDGTNFTNVQPETSGGDNETEICFIELTPGVVMAIARYSTSGTGNYGTGSGDSQHSLISYSQDYGTTWTPWKLSETLDNQNASSATGFVRNGKVEIFTGSRWYHYSISNVNSDYTNTGKDGAITHYVATVENALADKFSNLGVVVYAKATEDNIAAQDFHTPCVAVKDDDNMLLVYFDRVAPYTEASTNHYFVRGSRYGLPQQALNFSGAVTATYSGGKNVDVYIPTVEEVAAAAAEIVDYTIADAALLETIGSGEVTV